MRGMWQRTGKTRLRFTLIPIAALLLQFLTIKVLSSAFSVDLSRIAVLTSYLLLLAFIAINRRHIGILVVGIGLAMNFAAITANNGHMPVTAETAIHAGYADRIADVRLGEVVPGSTKILLAKSDTRLWLLSDNLAISSPFKSVFSIGDTIVGVGTGLVLTQFILDSLVGGRRYPYQG